jgi:peptidoglycan hydrolase-like protein with peptidoglycan-binding domain
LIVPVVVVLAVLAAAATAAVIVSSSKAKLSADPRAIAELQMPTGGAKIEKLSVVTGPHASPVPVTIRNGHIYPKGLVPAGSILSVQVVIKRPSWISWLSGATQRLDLKVLAPVASLRTHFITVHHGAPLRLHFKAPISEYSVLSAGHLVRHVLPTPSSVVTLLAQPSEAGSIRLAAAPRGWETSHLATVSWFPGGRSASAVVSPKPGATIQSGTPITLTFSKPVRKALGSDKPPISPATTGSWKTINSHTIRFIPSGYGYGLGAKVTLALPSGVRLVGGQETTTDAAASWTVPLGSTTRLQQLLAQLGYLPLRFNYSGTPTASTVLAQEGAAESPPAGTFSWRYPNTPATLKSFWQPGAYGTMTRGALMAFENDQGLPTDGIAGPLVWRALMSAAISGKASTFGYTWVSVDEAAQRLTLWHSGKTVIASTPVNTGVAAAPTATGTYPVYEHLPVTTMSGTNPDGSHYSDPGIPYVSYFNGGDALHGFLRAQYGFPQSLGCVEMPYSVAAAVYPYTPIGTLVHVA